MPTLKSLVDMYGEKLTWDTFAPYDCTEKVSSDGYILTYPIDADFCLIIGGVSKDAPPAYIRLVSKHDSSRYIDVRTGNIDDFIHSES